MKKSTFSDGTYTKVSGGNLIASASKDPHYPGIVISFKPDHSDTQTDLALLEEADGRLVLRSYMNTRREEPRSIECVYNEDLILQVAYGLYCLHAEEQPDFNTFVSEIFLDSRLMYRILPLKLHSTYREFYKKMVSTGGSYEK